MQEAEEHGHKIYDKSDMPKNVKKNLAISNNMRRCGIGIIFHLFTTVCKYGVSTLQNMVEIPSKFQMDF
jgi:hypothetical protein